MISKYRFKKKLFTLNRLKHFKLKLSKPKKLSVLILFFAFLSFGFLNAKQINKKVVFNSAVDSLLVKKNKVEIKKPIYKKLTKAMKEEKSRAQIVFISSRDSLFDKQIISTFGINSGISKAKKTSVLSGVFTSLYVPAGKFNIDKDTINVWLGVEANAEVSPLNSGEIGLGANLSFVNENCDLIYEPTQVSIRTLSKFGGKDRFDIGIEFIRIYKTGDLELIPGVLIGTNIFDGSFDIVYYVNKIKIFTGLDMGFSGQATRIGFESKEPIIIGLPLKISIEFRRFD